MSTIDPTTGTTATAAAPSKTLGILSLVAAGLSIFTGHLFVFAIAAIVLGALGLRREPAGRTLSTWGLIIGVVMVVLPVLAIVVGLSVLVPLGIFASTFRG